MTIGIEWWTTTIRRTPPPVVRVIVRVTVRAAAGAAGAAAAALGGTAARGVVSRGIASCGYRATATLSVGSDTGSAEAVASARMAAAIALAYGTLSAMIPSSANQ